MILPKETIVTSFPFLFTSANPIGIRYSPSGISPLSPYIFSDSKKTTGSSSRIADFNKPRSEEHTSELQSRPHLVCRLLLEKKKKKKRIKIYTKQKNKTDQIER